MPIIGEEGGLDEDPGRGARWYVDPIDGTSAYLEGLAYWGPTIGLVEDDTPVLGALWMPRLRSFWVAGAGLGAFKDGVRLDPPRKERIQARDVLYVPSHFHRIGPFPFVGKTRSLGSTACHLALVAEGAGAGAIIGRWSPWDVAAGILFIEEAGRVITDVSADPYLPFALADTAGPTRPRGTPFLVGDPPTVEHLAALLEPIRSARDVQTS